MFYKAIKIHEEIILQLPSPYNASFITYDTDGNIDNSKSDFKFGENINCFVFN